MTNPRNLRHLPPRFLSGRGSGFTLIELLVCVAIIGVLVSILVPFAGKMIARSKQGQCVSQMRQVFGVVSQYSADNQGSYPLAMGVAPLPRGWALWFWKNSPLAPYADGATNLQRISVCPENRTPAPPVETERESQFGYPYTVNYSIMLASSPPPALPPAAIRLFGNSRPSTTLLMADSSKGSSWGPGFGYWDAPALPRIGTPHAGKLNALWCDGHVTLEKKSELAAQTTVFLPK